VGFGDEIIPVGVPLGCTKYPWVSGNHLKTRVTVIFLDRVKLFEAHPLFLKRSMKMFCKICVNAPTTKMACRLALLCLSVRFCIFPYILTSVHTSFSMSLGLSIRPYICPYSLTSVHTSTSVHMSFSLSIHLPICPDVLMSACTSLRLPICLYFCPFVLTSVCTFECLSVTKTSHFPQESKF